MVPPRATTQNPVQAFFDEAAGAWDTHSKPDNDLLRDIVSALRLPPGARVLDVACGTGVMFEPLLACQPALLRAIDLSPEMARLAAQKMPGKATLQVSCADFYSFDETGFDLIMVYNAYPHFMDKTRFARQLARCLAPGGRFAIAHGAGKERINACHSGCPAEPISTPLLACAQEIERLGTAFCYDITLDGADMYLLSGVLAPR